MTILPSGTTVAELLRRYPTGFAVMSSGRIAECVFGSSHFVAVARAFQVAPPDGGYWVIDMRDEQLDPSAVPSAPKA